MDDLPFPQETDGVTYIMIFYYPQNVVVGGAGFLLRCHVLKKICDGIALGLEFTGIKWHAARGLRPDSGGVVDIIGAETGVLDLLGRQVPGELVNNSGHDLQVGQFFGTCIGTEMPLIK